MTSDTEFQTLKAFGHRLANLRVEHGWSLGVEVDDGVLDVSTTAATMGLDAPADLDDLLQNGGIEGVKAVIDAASAEPSRSRVSPFELTEFGPLVTRPGKIVCIGFNYQKHAEETGTKVGDAPPLFAKYSNALNGHRGTVALPTRVARMFDYETELVMVVGQRIRDVVAEDALAGIAGYATGNDVSARDLQTQTPQLTAGKISDGFAPIGPWLVPAGLVPDPNALRLQTWVNGVTRQDWTTSDMIFNCRDLVTYVAGILPLEPGDIIFTGTPQGVIFGEKAPMEQRDWLRAGDVVVSELEGLGRLEVTLR